MKRLVFLAALVAATFGASVALAQDVVDAYPQLRIGELPAGVVRPGTPVLVFGRLRDVAAACRSGHAIRLYRVRRGEDELLQTRTTDGDGEFRFTVVARQTMRVYARFPGAFRPSYESALACHSDTSRDVTITVSRLR